jgi:hypothetical protein
MIKPRTRSLRVLAGEPAESGPAQANPLKDDGGDSAPEPELTVAVPDDPPLLTPLAGEALLRLVQHVAARRDQADSDERRAA